MSDIIVTTIDDVGHINLRGDPQDAAFRKGVENTLGQSLPTDPNTMSVDDRRIYWLGPDEWLIVSAVADVDDLLKRLRDSLGGCHAAVNDLSGGQVLLRIAGEGSRDLLAKGCSLDFHPGVFRPGTCAQSGLAKANVLLGFIEEPDTFDVIVRRSFSDYLLRWLRQAGFDAGIEFR